MPRWKSATRSSDAVTPVDDEEVRAAIAKQGVISAARIHDVVAQAAVQPVVAGVAEQRVVARAPDQRVVPGAANDAVVHAGAEALEITRAFEHEPLDRAADAQGQQGGLDGVEAGAGRYDDHVTGVVDDVGVVAAAPSRVSAPVPASVSAPMPPKKPVVSVTAINQVVAPGAHDDIIAVEAPQHVVAVSACHQLRCRVPVSLTAIDAAASCQTLT